MNRDAIRRERDIRSWRQVRPLFLAMILVWLCIWAVLAQSAELTLTCTPPTKNTDGSAITGTIKYRFYWGTALPLTQTVDSSTCAARVTVPDPVAGQSVTYIAQATAAVGNVESARSNTASKTISNPISTPIPTPEPPAGLTVRSPNLSAYQIGLAKKNVLQAFAIGRVPDGTRCTTQRYLDLYVIEDNTKAILPAGTKRPIQILANCR